MAVVRPTDYSIRAGTQTVGSFSSSHYIINFPEPTDAKLHIPWATPLLTPDMYPQFGAVDTSLNANAYPKGKYKFAWTFDKWTPLMFKYWCDTFLSTTAFSATVTVKTYTQFEVAVYLVCKMQRPVVLTPVRGAGFDKVKIEFKLGTVIT